jgi:hypothetical protein
MNYELLNLLFDAFIWIPIGIMAIAYLFAIGIRIKQGRNK